MAWRFASKAVNRPGMMSKVWLVEADKALRDTLLPNLAGEGHQVTHIGQGAKALRMAMREPPELLILDISRRGVLGVNLCQALRLKVNAPIVVVTSPDSLVDPIAALDGGADDYLVKPFSLGEFDARLPAVLRRASQEVPAKLQAGDLSLDLIGYRAFHRGKALKLSRKEFDLLAELIRHSGAALSRAVLLEHVWGAGHGTDTRTVDVHIRLLREKIEENAGNPQRIQTVRGFGYRFDG